MSNKSSSGNTRLPSPSESRVILQETGVAPPPSRDFYRIRLTEDEFILTRWNISYAKTSHPEDFRFPLVDYHFHPKTISDVARIFGKAIQQRVIRQAKSRSPLILGLPPQVLIRILYFIGVKDICPIGCTCSTLAKMKYIPAGQEPDKQTLTRVSYLGWKFLFFDNHICNNVFPGRCMTMRGYREQKKNLGIANWAMAVQRPHMMENRGKDKIVGGGSSTPPLSFTSLTTQEKNEKKRVEEEVKIQNSLRDILDRLKRRKNAIVSGLDFGSRTLEQQRARRDDKEKTMEFRRQHHHHNHHHRSHKEDFGGAVNKIRGQIMHDENGFVGSDPDRPKFPRIPSEFRF